MRPTLAFPSGLISWKVTLNFPDKRQETIQVIAATRHEAIQAGVETLQMRVASQPERFIRALPEEGGQQDNACLYPPLL